MDLPALVEHYGFLAVLLGALAEGETFLLLGGFAAHRGYLGLGEVVLAGFLGGLLGDQIYYWLGRRHGERLLARFPTLAPGAALAREKLRRHAIPFILSMRFLYGLRTVGPLAVGMSGVPPLRYLALNALGAAIWAPAVVGAGYLFGQAVEHFLADLLRYEEALFLGTLAVALLVGLMRRRRHRPLSR